MKTSTDATAKTSSPDPRLEPTSFDISVGGSAREHLPHLALQPKVKVQTGIEEKNRKMIVEHLQIFLANMYTLYVKTQNFHWNVTGPHFRSLHSLFEDQYKDLADAVDTVAERIRALGYPVAGTMADFTQSSTIKEERDIPTPERMVHILLDGHEAVISELRDLFPVVEGFHDQATVDLLAKRIREHEKTAWMLRSVLD